MAKDISKLRDLRSDEALLRRTEESHQRMNEYGKFGRFYSAPEGITLKTWKCKEGEHIIDIIPFLAGSQHHQTKENNPTYLVDIWVHQKVGVNENDFICLARNYNESCPICEYINAQRMKDTLLEPEEESLPKEQQDAIIAAREKAIDDLNPKRRCLYNIVCYDSTREEDRGVQLWEIAHFLFEKKLLAIAREPRGGGFVPFASADKGKSIYFEREGSGMTNTQYLGHKFIDRQTPISDDILRSAYTIDELLDKPAYELVESEFYGGLRRPPSKTTKEASKVKGDDIPEETNRIAQRLKAAGEKVGESSAEQKAAKQKAATEGKSLEKPEPAKKAAPAQQKSATGKGRGIKPITRQRSIRSK